MQSKTLYLLLALSLMVAIATGYEDEDFFDDLVDNAMEKRGRRRRNKLVPCPGREKCMCVYNGKEYVQLICAQSGKVGL
ncbi:hypothetical protein HOLleu_22478 [Holothuria leucospilota]|uniref:Uncharacterized protein n=1 Tax=Holothuria leucospilota TaxID=206669 RepID=A0A9Q1BZB4_HOLLE|nr:hypothetical protein HOLleu_22478 [Holothuria leucospilota]